MKKLQNRARVERGELKGRLYLVLLLKLVALVLYDLQDTLELGDLLFERTFVLQQFGGLPCFLPESP
jgi:hypothetical protein